MMKHRQLIPVLTVAATSTVDAHPDHGAHASTSHANLMFVVLALVVAVVASIIVGRTVRQ